MRMLIADLFSFSRAGGMPAYVQTLEKSLDNDLQGWTYSLAKA